MTLRLNDYVIGGELGNFQENVVSGRIDFDHERSVQLELAGNLPGQFAGRRFRFRVDRPESSPVSRERLSYTIESLGTKQQGKVGDVLLRQVKVPTFSNEESVRRYEAGEAVPFKLLDCLYLEWSSEIGRVVAEIIDIEIDFIDQNNQTQGKPQVEPLPNHSDTPPHTTSGPMSNEVSTDEFGNETEEVYSYDQHDSEDDQYGLFDKDLDEQIRQSLMTGASESDSDSDTANQTGFDSQAAGEAPPTPKPWQEILPGLDRETLAKFDAWDEIVSGVNEVPIMDLLGDISFVEPSSLSSDEQAVPHLDHLLDRLDELNIVIERCDHLTPLEIYQILIDKVLPGSEVDPNLSLSNMIEHFCLWDYCPACLAEFEGVDFD